MGLLGFVGSSHFNDALLIAVDNTRTGETTGGAAEQNIKFSKFEIFKLNLAYIHKNGENCFRKKKLRSENIQKIA